MNSIIKSGKLCLCDEADALISMIGRLDENFERAVDLICQCTGKCIKCILILSLTTYCQLI